MIDEEIFNRLTGEYLTKVRESLSLNQEEAAEHLNKSRSWLACIENGLRGIRWVDLKEICKVYGITPSNVGKYIDENS